MSLGITKNFFHNGTHNDARVFNTVPRIVFKIPPPCWIKRFFFLGVFVLLFANVLNTFFFFVMTTFFLSVTGILWWMILLMHSQIVWIKAGFADFNKTFLCEGKHLCNNLKLADCFSVRLVMLTLSLLSYEWEIIYRKSCIYVFSKLGCGQFIGDLRHWKFWHELDICHLFLVSCRVVDRIWVVWLRLRKPIVNICIFLAWIVSLNS